MSLLRELGYTNVKHYPGGLTEWFTPPDEEPPTGSQPTEPAGSNQATVAAPNVSVARPTTVAKSAPVLLTASTRFIDALSERSVGSLFRWWLAMVVGCAVAYWVLDFWPDLALRSSGESIGSGLNGGMSALYFSAITATSVGYGDIVPVGIARAIAVFESIAGLILFGCVVSKFVSRRQDQLLGELHHIAFEDRLGRVRTNLLLVRVELQATARLCEGAAMPPPEALARVESAAMVFVGELRAVHDLLYEPTSTPEEPVLEAILAGLVSVFLEFKELLICVQSQRTRQSAILSSSIATMSRLAREICGDCVPRAFAPSLRNRMDEIQRIAAEVEHV